MPNFKPYPTVATIPNRKARKAQRGKIFQENSGAYTAARKARREAKRKVGL